MKQELLARRDELARAYQLGELLQQVAPKPFWRNWRVIAIIAFDLSAVVYTLIYALVSGKGTLDGGALNGILVISITIASMILLTIGGFRLSYPISGVYVYTHGMVYLLRHRQFVARWEQLGGVYTQSAGKGSWLHVQRYDGSSSIDFSNVYFDLKALESIIESTRYHSSGVQKN